MGELTIFAKRMKEARENCNLRQNALASKVGVTAQTISAYEKAGTDGKGKNPTLENAVAIANELGVSLDWLCGRDIPTEEAESKKTLGDIARSLVFLEKSVAGVYLDTSTRIEEKVTYSDNTGYPYNEDVQVTYPSIVFTNEKLVRFIKEWRKIKSLHDTSVIDDELYNLWLDKHLSLLDDTPAVFDYSKVNFSNSDKYAEIDDEDGDLPF